MAFDMSLGIASEAIRIVVEPNTFVLIGGTSLSGRLTVLRGADQWQLAGQDQALTHDNKPYLSFQPVEEKVAYLLLLETAQSGSSNFVDAEYARDFKATKHVVPNFATYYTIHVADEADESFTLTIALIGASKAAGVAPIASESPNLTGPIGQNNPDASVGESYGVRRRKDSIRLAGPNSSTNSFSTGPNDASLSVVTPSLRQNNPGVSVTGRYSTKSRKVSTRPIGPKSSTGLNDVDTNVSVVTPGLDSTSRDVIVDEPIGVQPLPTGFFILRNVYTNYELTAVIDTSPAMLFATGQVPVEWRTWKIALSGSDCVLMSNEVKTHRYLQEGATLVETKSPNPIRLIRTVTQDQEECYHISTDQSAGQDLVLSDPSPLGVPGGKLQTTVLEINAPQQLWILVPVS
ncbi:hypothetical protein GGX14DRAFT_677562 [Mycena pura]|uniref:Uncharacterized protein n=1 Tax=Mycena pura TaxID=153505 RepID=A0AAD6UYC4_9AGAR|nr:hypothetical protein GGX14DRAFT_677562 [Mycena pura]